VLVLFQQQAETQPMVEFTQRLRLTIRDELASPVEFYQEALDLDRFSDREHSPRLTDYFRDKYHGFTIDVVVPVGARALGFAVDHLHDVLPNAPIVFALCAAPQTDPSTLPAYVTGRLASASRFVPTVAMARGLQPDAGQIVAVGGAASTDSVAVSAVVSAVAAFHDSPPLTVVQGLPLDALLARLRQLPRRSIVIFANYRGDGHGQVFEPFDIVGSLARAASAPMYTQLGSYVGEGVVGGSVTRFDDEGTNTGRLVVRVLRRRPGQMPPAESITNSYVADWRQLQRWDLSEKRLPPGTELLFREPSLWQRYRAVVLIALGFMGVESLLIGALLLERRRRKRAQLLVEDQRRRTDDTRRQVAHMGRMALVGELAATIGHELRQPLAAMRANAETGAKFVAGADREFGPEDRRLCGEIFSDIIADNDQASEVIIRVRALLRGQELPSTSVDLNEVCRASARLLQHEALTRHAELSLSLDPHLPAVTGDPVQFEQVVLNLVLNALEASGSSPSPRVLIRTVGREEEVDVVVSDNGPGFAAGAQPHLFESFFTTKPQGLGLGLVIVQSIVERYRGRISAENGEEGGATFHVTIPTRRVIDSVGNASR
jgi:signal transduction histidine kinase